MDNLREIKFREYYQLLNKWLQLKIYKRDISGYFLKNGVKKVGIYGMGEIGKRLYDDLIDEGKIDVRFFIDKGKACGYLGMDVFDLEGEIPNDIDLIVVTVGWAFNEIKENLERKVSVPIVAIDEIINASLPHKIIPFLVVSVGQACNFKCKDCGTMAPYSPKMFKRYKVEKIVEDINIISENVDFIERLQIQGGEPFLYRDLNVLLEFVAKEEKIREIEIATNGSIEPSDDMMQFISQNKIEIRISDYGLVREQSLSLKQKCEEFGVKSWYYTFTNEQSNWYYKGVYDVKREENDDVVNKRFMKCNNNVCLTLERGALSLCSRGANAYAIQNFELLPSDKCIVDNRETFGEELMNYITNKVPMEACRYCYGTDDSRLVPVAEQLL